MELELELEELSWGTAQCNIRVVLQLVLVLGLVSEIVIVDARAKDNIERLWSSML